MKPEYITYEDITTRDRDGEPVRGQGPPIMRHHSAADLRMHRAAGIVAAVLVVAMLATVLALAIA